MNFKSFGIGTVKYAAFGFSGIRVLEFEFSMKSIKISVVYFKGTCQKGKSSLAKIKSSSAGRPLANN